ncbi:MAG: leucine-rich repeat protein [Prevotella sp.]|nr:leucine-rich repeat protein [Prevotella sp.]
MQEKAFYYNNDITSVVLPNTIKGIPEQAFYNCKNLKSIAWPTQLTSIGKQAFYFTAIDSLFLPDQVETISAEAFSTCINLKYVELPKSLKSIGEKAFYNGGNIHRVISYIEEPFEIPENVFFVNTSDGEVFGWGDLYVPVGTKDKYLATTGWNSFATIIEMEPETPEPEYKDGDRFTAKTPEGVEMSFMVISAADKTCMTVSRDSRYPMVCIDSNTTGTVTIPSEVNGFKVVQIGEETFSSLDGLTAINISDGITTIDRLAIGYCENITSIYIPASVTSIGEGNFSSCHNLNSIVVDSKNPVYDSRNNCNAVIETATKKVVAGCNTTVLFDGITAIGARAFIGVLALSTFNLPSTVTSIEDLGFYGCSNLQSVVVPKTVTSMGVAPFEACNGLTSLSVEAGNPNYDSRENCNAIIETKTEKLINACNVSFIPEGIKTIGIGAFYGLRNIEVITIPKSVESIEGAAFYGCPNLKIVKSFIEEPFVPGYACFWKISKDATLYVPIGTKAKYEATDGWKDFKNIVEMAPYDVLDDNTVAAHFLEPDEDGKLEIPATVEIDGKTYTVTAIAAGAFKDNKELTEVTIPGTVTTIGDGAFAGCENLRAIYVYAPEPISLTATEVRNMVKRAAENVPSQFEGIDFEACTLYVPVGSEQKYREAEGWKLFTHIVGVENPAGIATIHTEKNGYSAVYNLSGQRLAAPQKGLNIIGGKKVVVR